MLFSLGIDIDIFEINIMLNAGDLGMKLEDRKMSIFMDNSKQTKQLIRYFSYRFLCFKTHFPRAMPEIVKIYEFFAEHRRVVFPMRDQKCLQTHQTPGYSRTLKIHYSTTLKICQPCYCNVRTFTGVRGGPINFKKCIGIRIRQT